MAASNVNLSQRQKQANEHENLSQQMEGLSTHTGIQSMTLELKDIIPTLDQVPSQLRRSHPAFQERLRRTLSIMGVSIDNRKIKGLRKIALLIFRLKMIQLYQDLWTTYWKAGTGQLVRSSQEKLIYATDQGIWPNTLKQQYTSQVKTAAATAQIYQNLIQQSLEVLHVHLQHSQAELDLKTGQCQGYSSTVQKRLENYVDEALQQLRRQIEHDIQLVHYDYHIRAIKTEFRRHQPDRSQQQLMMQVCREKYEQQTAEQEHRLVQKRVSYYSSSSQSYDASTLAHLSLLNSIDDLRLRQEFHDRLKQVAKTARLTLFDLCLKTAEKDRLQCQRRYNASVKKMSDHRSMADGTPTPRIMIELIKERCKKIEERIRCVYRLKEEEEGVGSDPK